MASSPAIAEAKYVSFTTFTRDGRPKALPVWIVDLGDGKVGFATMSSSYKVRRLSNDPRCTLQPCDAKGKLLDGTEPVSGTATVSKADYETVKAKVAKKYGYQFHLISLAGKIGKLIGRGMGSDTAVIITLDS